MAEWKRYVEVATIPLHRRGWVGVWDAVVAVITRRPRATVLTECTFSVWATAPVELKIYGAQVEMREKDA